MTAGTMAPSGRPASDASSDFLKRWLVVWVVLLAVVTLVVVVFLVTITNSLASINGNLAVADRAVTGAGGDTKTLPDQVDQVNGSLGGIDPALKPIPGQADQIIASLVSIDGKLRRTDGSLKDTSGVLKTVLGQVGDIRGVLVDANDPPDKMGVQNIHRRIAVANGQGDTGDMASSPANLSTAKGDTANILAGLVDVNKHLTNVCRSAAVQASGPQPC